MLKYTQFRYILFVGCLFVGSLLILSSGHLQAKSVKKPALLLKVDDAIGPATAEYILTGLNIAQKEQSPALIIELDTPGGLDSAMRDIIKGILASPVPVITYVAPSGARASSAGTYILYASSIAAMAPGTNMGAATPVSIGTTPAPTDKSSKKDKNFPAIKSDMKRKIKKDATAYIRSLAEMHGRNINWSKKAVLESDSLSAKQALKLGVIDLIASNISDLLNKIDGRKVVANGQSVTLKTKGLHTRFFQPDWRIKILSVITNPSVAYILLMIGVYGLFFEFASPGLVAPGVIGGIALLLGLYALQLLPINYAGLAMIFLGIAFIIAEAFIPSFGVLGIGGITAFVIGSIMLFRADVPGMHIPWVIIAVVAIVNAIFFFAVVGLALKAYTMPKVTGSDAMIGSIGVVRDDCDGTGWVNLKGESWQCASHQPLKRGQSVKIVKVEGLVVNVEPIE